MKKRMTAALLAVFMLAGCGSKSEEDIQRIDDLKSRVTSVDTELATMYGKLEDMHETGLIDDDFYNEFMTLDSDADECMSYAEKSGVSADKLEEMVKKLESDFADCKKRLNEINGENDEKLMQELIVLQFAVKEQGGLMKRALDAGKITQDDYDEFIELQKKVDKYNAETDLKYDDDFRAEIAEMRSRLTALASKAGADNALIDRLVGSETAENGSEEVPPSSDGVDIRTAEKSEIEPETEVSTPEEGKDTANAQKPEIPENITKLINDYMALQEFASQKQASGEIDDLAYIDLLGKGVELSYLKEAVEKDGVTENNTYTMQDIKASLYEKAQKLGYDKAEVFK
ncbi:MAG: hypothetical protein IJR59_05335 [Firmicutes bacterium]|nr:hypothetical protein [Bacillota bacterium]